MTNDRRLEVLIASTLVVVGAVFMRAEYIPASAEDHVEMAGERYEMDLGEPNRWFAAWAIGDGQVFAVIAADPTGDKLSREIKEPVYRFTRAGFGWLAAVASLGREPWIPYGMALVGTLALLGNLLVAIRMRDRLGMRAWILVANPALYIGFGGDTAEPLALLLLAYGIGYASVWATMALGVTRPSYLVAHFGRWRQLSLGVSAALLLLVYSVIRFGADRLIPSGGRIDLPLAGFIQNPSLPGWVLAVLAAITVGVGLKRRDLAWVVSGILALSLGSDVTFNVENAWRAAGMLPVLWAFGPNYPAPAEEPLSAGRVSQDTGM